MKNLILSILILAAILSAFTAAAQMPARYGVYTTNAGAIVEVNGGTNVVLFASTNGYAAFPVSEYDNVGLEVTVKATTAATTTFTLLGWRSLGSGYETDPYINRTITLNGTTDVCTITNLSVPSAASLKLALGNTNAAISLTNVVIARRFKAPAHVDR